MRKELGRGKPIASSEHRFCARIWDFGCFASVYGPAGVADNACLHRCLTTMTNHRRPSFLIGDFNWVSAYSRSLPGSWFVSDNFPTVIGVDAGPTRVVSLRQFGGPEKPSLAEALPGIPHHKATVWTCPKFPHEQVPLRRLRRCARFEPATKPTDAQRNSWSERHGSCGTIGFPTWTLSVRTMRPFFVTLTPCFRIGMLLRKSSLTRPPACTWFKALLGLSAQRLRTQHQVLGI